MWFVKAEKTARKENDTKLREQSVGLLNISKDLELQVDFDKRLFFPCEIETQLRPDTVMFSTAKKLLIMIELIVQ